MAHVALAPEILYLLCPIHTSSVDSVMLTSVSDINRTMCTIFCCLLPQINVSIYIYVTIGVQ